MPRFLIILSLFAIALPVRAAVIQGPDLLTGEELKIAIESPKKKGTVVVFISAKCPCSTSHQKHLNELAQKFTDFEFVGVHSNSDEPLEFSRERLKGQVNFRIVQDKNAAIADEYKAFKTPHVFVFNNEGKSLYRGGVSSSADFARSEKFFLQEALEDLQAGRPVRLAEGRTLGCMITRTK